MAQDQASVREGSAWAGQDAARQVEAPAPAVLVEDGREGKEHLEFEKASTSCLFGIATGSGRTAWIALSMRPLRDRQFQERQLGGHQAVAGSANWPRALPAAMSDPGPRAWITTSFGGS